MVVLDRIQNISKSTDSSSATVGLKFQVDNLSGATIYRFKPSYDRLNEGYVAGMLVTDTSLSPLKRDLLSKARKLGLDVPNEWALNLTENIIKKLKFCGINPEFVNPHGEGGVMIEFFQRNDVYLIEVYNDQEIVYLIDSNDQISTFDLDETGLNRKLNTLYTQLLGVNV
jgi:hypothetical protein